STFRETVTSVSTTPFASAVTVPTSVPPTFTSTFSPGFQPGPDVTWTTVPVGPEPGSRSAHCFSTTFWLRTRPDFAPTNERECRRNVVASRREPSADPN